MNKPTRNILLYTAIAYALIWAVGLVFLLSGLPYASSIGMAAASLCMLFPLVATLIAQKKNGEPLLRHIGVSWKINRWWFVGWLLMPVVALLTLVVSSWMPGMSYSPDNEVVTEALTQMSQQTGVAFTPSLFILITLLSGLFAGATINALFAFGEEIGWRGYLLQQFRGKNFLASAILIGLIWGLWHAPLILLGHNYPQHPVAGVFMMMLFCAALTPLIQYIRLKSGSVIPAAIMHGTLNATIGMSNLFISNFNDLLCGGPGLAGILVLLSLDILLFLFDRHITKDNLLTCKL